MRFKFLIGFILLVGMSAKSIADVAAPITSVVLYPGSATIVRSVNVPAGATQITVPGLPVGFDTQTLRAEASAGIRIAQIVTQDAARTEAANPAEASLEASIQALQDQRAALDVETKSGEIVKSYLERLGGGASPQDRAPVATDPKNLAAVIETIGREATTTLSHMQRITLQQREIDKKIDALQRDLTRLVTGAKATRTVSINLAAGRAGVLQLSYQMNNAGWRPAYRAQLDSANSQVELERLATVSQKSGEDWTNVKLTLSTSQPRLSPNAVEPAPWLLYYFPPRPTESINQYSANKPAPTPVPMVMAGKALARAASGAEQDAYEPPTFETQSAFATEFEVPARVTLPADGREVSVALAEQTLSVKQRLRVTPRLERAAIVTVEAERPAGIWLPGNIQLLRDGNYIGAANWNPRVGEPFMFFFGRDDLLRVSIDQKSEKSGTTGIFDKQNERKMSDVISLTNSHKTPVEVLVLESSPVSTSSEIKVQAVFEPKPGIVTWEQKQGVVAWVKTLTAGETYKIGIDYDIQYDKEGSVSGLH